MLEEDDDIYCPLLNCWELCNIGTDEILLEGDEVSDWDEALRICDKCGRYND